MSTVTADRTGKIVLLTYSLTALIVTEAHLADVSFPRSFDSMQSCSARLKSLLPRFDLNAKKYTGSAS